MSATTIKSRGIWGRLLEPIRSENRLNEQKTTTNVDDLTSDLQSLINVGYHVSDQVQVAEFLQTNPFVIKTLQEMYPVLRSYFADARFELGFDLYDAFSEYTPITVSIISDKSYSEANAILERFDDEWWIERMPQTKGMISVYLEP